MNYNCLLTKVIFDWSNFDHFLWWTLSKWILEEDPGADLGQFGLEHFGPRADDRAWVRQASEQFYGTYYDIR